MVIERIIPYIPTCTPTSEDIENYLGEYLILTPNLPKWNLYTHDYRDQEYRMLDYKGNVTGKLLKINNKERKVIPVASSNHVHLIHALSTYGIVMN